MITGRGKAAMSEPSTVAFKEVLGYPLTARLRELLSLS